MLHPNELEFFIDTNALVPAERALQIGTELLVFLRQPEALGPEAEIRLAHLGQGSLIARVMVLMRDPATASAAALLGAAFAGVSALEGGEGDFPEAVAQACIESNALRCGFRVGNSEFFVERDKMPAIKRVEVQITNGAPETLPPAGYTYVTKDGNYVKEGGDFVLHRILGRIDSGIKYAVGSFGSGALGGSPLASGPIGATSSSSAVTDDEVDYLSTEDGDVLTTEDGEPLVVEDLRKSDRPTAPGHRDQTVELDGRFFTGVSNYVFHALDGRRFEVLFRNETQGPPTATPVRIVAQITDVAPREGLADSVLLVDRWERRDKAERRKEVGLFDGDHEEKDRLTEVFGKLGENEFFAVGHVRKAPGVAYFDADDGSGYRIENSDAVRKIRSGEIAAVLEQRGEPLEDGLPRVWLVKFQTAPYNLDD